MTFSAPTNSVRKALLSSKKRLVSSGVRPSKNALSGVAVALPFPPVVALDAAYGFLFEFVHVEYEIGHSSRS
jgi:hypothetical protein